MRDSGRRTRKEKRNIGRVCEDGPVFDLREILPAAPFDTQENVEMIAKSEEISVHSPDLAVTIGKHDPEESRHDGLGNLWLR